MSVWQPMEAPHTRPYLGRSDILHCLLIADRLPFTQPRCYQSVGDTDQRERPDLVHMVITVAAIVAGQQSGSDTRRWQLVVGWFGGRRSCHICPPSSLVSGDPAKGAPFTLLPKWKDNQILMCQSLSALRWQAALAARASGGSICFGCWSAISQGKYSEPSGNSDHQILTESLTRTICHLNFKLKS